MRVRSKVRTQRPASLSAVREEAARTDTSSATATMVAAK